MPITILLVDDSSVIRALLGKSLSGNDGMEVVGQAENGQVAVRLAGELKPDIIILDIEMPVLDGLTALPKLLEASPGSKIIMSSTLTLRNAEISMKALELGASDYLAKPSFQTGQGAHEFFEELRHKIKGLAQGQSSQQLAATSQTPASSNADAKPLPITVKALAVASSTGGPQALIEVFGKLKGQLMHLPIFITQHMPASFTTVLADHISRAADRACIEVKGGEIALPGIVYLARGDYHMVPKQKANGEVEITINQTPPENFCRPAADPMFRALAGIYGKQLLAVVLTGMGSDGMKGAQTIVEKGGAVLAQDKASCVVYGMPKAVVDNNLAHAVLPLAQIPPYLSRYVEGKR